LASATTWTVEGWFYPQSGFSSGSESYVLDTRDSPGTSGFGLCFFGTSATQAVPGVWTTGAGGQGGQRSSGYPVNVNSWSHVVWQKKTSNTLLDIYVNGVFVTGGCPIGANFSTAQDWRQLTLAKLFDYSNFTYSGRISQLRINSGVTYVSNFTPSNTLPKLSNTVFLLGASINDAVSGTNRSSGGTISSANFGVSL
jgi:hypothetical protein